MPLMPSMSASLATAAPRPNTTASFTTAPRSSDLGQRCGGQRGRICRADHIGCQDREQTP